MIPENPPAFPQPLEKDELGNIHSSRDKSELDSGMTLRDYFAAKALQGVISNSVHWDGKDAEAITRHAYKFADAMLAERAKK